MARLCTAGHTIRARGHGDKPYLGVFPQRILRETELRLSPEYLWPKSKPHGKHFIRSVLLDAFDKEQKLKFIDFGVGRGTYSNLLRDVFPESSWTGVEIYEPYILSLIHI